MPGVLAVSDRKLLTITGVVLFVLVLLVSLVSPQATQRAESTPSSYASDSGGALAAYSLLQEMHRNVSRWEEPPNELPDAEDVVLIIADPQQTPSERERASLLQFVKKGGRVLFTGPGAGAFFEDANSTESGSGGEPVTFEANVPSGFTRGAPKISMRQEAEWLELHDSQIALYGESESPAVLSWRIGKGIILWWAGATPLTNAGILAENNPELFLDAVSDPMAPADEQPDIYWDEYFHGERSSLSAYIGKTPIPWGILQIAIIGIAVFLAFGRRSGPIAIPAVVSRLSPLEFVDTLAGLYQRAHAEPAVIGIVYQRLRTGLSRQLRLSSAVSDTELGHAVSQRLGANGADFVHTMQRAGAASRAAAVPAAEAFSIVTSLEDYEEQFGLKRRRS